ncbi:MAG: thrombospondin type 3 repeat-containing protein, partial [Proteobacteria bacterium]|nr:thrombospondin type 3 repeat-containing protein [Pseudomonadota bacterium]
MVKQNKNQMYWILGVIAIAVFFYGGQVGWFKSSFNLDNKYPPANPVKIIELNKPPTTSEVCTLLISPLVIYSGDYLNGIIQDGKNTFCEIYADDGSGWRQIYTGTTDNTGKLLARGEIEWIGNLEFKALCGSCITNEVTINVNERPDEPEDESEGNCNEYCTLSWTFDYGYQAQSCEPGETNYWYFDMSCCCGDTGSTDMLCTDSDGLNYNNKGDCEVRDGDYYFHGGDNCPSYFKVNEFTCVNNRCVETLYTCPSNSCINGACVPMPDTDGDGYSDEDEIQAGTNPNDPNSYPGGFAEICADSCKNVDYAGSYYMPSGSLNSCQSYAYETCFP